MTVQLTDPVYVGLAVSSHNADVLETAVFDNVSLQQTHQAATSIKKSNVSVYDLKSKTVKVVYTTDQMVEAPNWSPDGKYLLVNSKGDLWKLPVDGSSHELQKIDLGSVARCHND